MLILYDNMSGIERACLGCLHGSRWPCIDPWAGLCYCVGRRGLWL